MDVSRRFSSMLVLSLAAHGAVLTWLAHPPLAPDLGTRATRAIAIEIVATAPATTAPPAIETRPAAQPPRAARRTPPAGIRTHQPAAPAKSVTAVATMQSGGQPRTTPAASSRASAAPAVDTQSVSEHISQAVSRHLQAHFEYPWLARKRNWQGDVVLALRIEGDGRLSRIELGSSSGHATLDRSALQSAQRIGQVPEAIDWLGGAAYDLRLPVSYRLTDG